MLTKTVQITVLLFLLASLAPRIVPQARRSNTPEDVAVQKLCAFENSTKELVLASRFEFRRVDAFSCVSRILAGLNNLRLVKDQKVEVGERLIWNMASLLQESDSLDPALKNTIVPMLRQIAKDDQNPM